MATPSRSHAVRMPPLRKQQRLPSFQTFVCNAPAYLRVSQATASLANAKALRRCSSVSSRATRCWDESPLWREGTIPSTSVMGETSFTESSPQLVYPNMSLLTPELQESPPPLLEPRIYQPVLPTTSNFLPPSLRKRSSNVTTLSLVVPRNGNIQTSPMHIGENVDMSPSPPPITPIKTDKFSLLNDDNSMSVDLPSNGFRHTRSQLEHLTPTATLSGPFDWPTDTHWRKDSIDRAFSHMRLGSDVSIYFEQNAIDPKTRAKKTDNILQASEDILSPDFRHRLIDEYRSLASPANERWQDEATDSDVEATGNELRMVPAPLFWENRQRELYPQRDLYARQRQARQSLDAKVRALAASPEPPPRKKHRKKISLPDAASQMMLPKRYKRKSTSSETGDSPTTAALKRALALRLHARKEDVDRVSRENAPRLFHGKPISKPILDGPMPLHLPIFAYNHGKTHKHTVNHAPERNDCGAHEDLAELEYTVPLHKDINEVDIPLSQPSRLQGHGAGSKSSLVMQGLSSSRKLPHSSSLSSGGGLHSRLRKISIPPGVNSLSNKGHSRDLSHGSKSSSERSNVISAFSPVDDGHKLTRPAIFEKAVDAIRGRERSRRRKNLKSQIKVVRQIDPVHINQPPQGKRRRETFGEGWI